MGLTIEPVIPRPLPRRRMRLDIDADLFLKLLTSLDGKRRFRAKGLPSDVRCVGLRTSDLMLNTVSMVLESEQWPEVPQSQMLPELALTLAEYSGDAMPEDE